MIAQAIYRFGCWLFNVPSRPIFSGESETNEPDIIEDFEPFDHDFEDLGNPVG